MASWATFQISKLDSYVSSSLMTPGLSRKHLKPASSSPSDQHRYQACLIYLSAVGWYLNGYFLWADEEGGGKTLLPVPVQEDDMVFSMQREEQASYVPRRWWHQLVCGASVLHRYGVFLSWCLPFKPIINCKFIPALTASSWDEAAIAI